MGGGGWTPRGSHRYRDAFSRDDDLNAQFEKPKKKRLKLKKLDVEKIRRLIHQRVDAIVVEVRQNRVHVAPAARDKLPDIVLTKYPIDELLEAEDAKYIAAEEEAMAAEAVRKLEEIRLAEEDDEEDILLLALFDD